LPLTPLEFNEWGNPIVHKEIFDYIRSYSPYDNIKPQQYPHVYMSSGLYDQRVTYWEPLKFVAKLRNIMKDQMLFLKMNMNAGHSGASGRFDYIYEIAEEDVFLLTAFDKHK
jgi:oligopeptidase B